MQVSRVGEKLRIKAVRRGSAERTMYVENLREAQVRIGEFVEKKSKERGEPVHFDISYPRHKTVQKRPLAKW